MRVVTLNVWARGGDWSARRALLTAGFAALAPDLVALQETVVDAGKPIRACRRVFDDVPASDHYGLLAERG